MQSGTGPDHNYVECRNSEYGNMVMWHLADATSKHHYQGIVMARAKSNRVCSIYGCGERHVARGWCRKHYYRWKHKGHPLSLNQTPQGEPLDYLISSIAAANEDDCLIWPYAIIDGYGSVYVEGRSVPVHRHALFLYTGINPSDRFACHGPCHNRACFNPHHLSWMTRSENEMDKVRDGTSNRGEGSGHSKITEIDVLAIRSDVRKNRDIAREYGITPSNVGHIKKRRTWAWLSDSEEV